MDVIVGVAHLPFGRRCEGELADRLCDELRACGHRAEILALPFLDHRDRALRLDELLAGRLLGLGSAGVVGGDCYIAVEASAALLHHPRKIIWITSSGMNVGGRADGDHDEASLIEAYNVVLGRAVGEARRTFARSLSAALQLKVGSEVDTLVLYPPSPAPLSAAGSPGKHALVVAPIMGYDGRRQIDALLAALRGVPGLRLRFVDVDGVGLGDAVAEGQRQSLEERYEWRDVSGAASWGEIMEGARAMVNLCRDEPRPDVPLVALRMGLPLIAAADSGAPAELVHHGESGWLVDGEGGDLEAALGAVTKGGADVESMQTAAFRLYRRTVLSWPDTIARLLA